MSAWAPELTEVLPRGLAIGRVGSFGCGEGAQAQEPSLAGLATKTDRGAKPSTAWLDAFVASRCSAFDLSVSPVVLAGRFSDVLPAVVQWVLVAMIKVRWWFIARHPLPDHTMGRETPAADTDHQMIRLISIGASGVDAASRLSSEFAVCRPSGKRVVEMMRRSMAPDQRPVFRLIIEAFAQVVLRWQGAWSHWISPQIRLVRGGSGGISTGAASHCNPLHISFKLAG
jgi:hypothetical protein